MNIDIVTIGDEILIGQIVDTNSAWMGQQLNAEGIHVRQITSIGDDPDQIRQTLSEAANRVDLVLVTGGLGPTRDDRTKSVICDFFGTELTEDAQVLAHVENLLQKRGISVNKLNREQALVPAKALVFQNELGTAPGLLLKKERCTYIFMPGVPFEMKYLMEAEVLPYIRKNFQTSTIFHKTILTFGLPESMLAEKIEKWEDGLPDHIRLAYLPSPQGVKLRLSARGKPMDQMVQEVKEKVDRLLELIPGNIYGYDNENPALNLGRMLESNGWTLSTAESCTGGTIARMITDNPGSSAYFKGSVVAYANETKTKILGVKQSSLEQEGAVSASVVEQMAVNVCELLGTDFAMATSGIAGPGGGTGEKPVGTIWIAVARGSQVVSQCFNFGNDRERNMTRTAHQALFMLRNFILNLVQ